MKQFLTIILVLVSLTALSTNYYISLTGNNANSGSITSPLRTFAYACGKAVAGDSIIVNPGVFVEMSFADIKPYVSVRGLDSATCEIKAGYAANHLVFLRSTAEGTNGNQSISNIKFNGNNRTGLKALWVKGRSNVTITRCTFIDFNDDGVSISGKANGLVGPPAIFATGNVFSYNTIINCSKYEGYGRGGFNFSGQDGLIVIGNRIIQKGRTVGTNGYCIKFYEEGYSKNVKMTYNYIEKAPYDGLTFDFAIEQWNCLGGWEFAYNTVIGAFDMAGFSKGSAPHSIDYHHNTAGGSTQPSVIERAIELEGRPNMPGCSDVIIRDSYFKNLHTPISIQNNNEGGRETYTNIYVYRNVFEGIGKSTAGGGGGSVFYINAADATGIYNGFYFWNNVFDGKYPQAFDGLQIDGIGTMTNVSIRNNIFLRFSRAPIFSWSSKGGTINTMSVQNNIYHLNGTNAWVGSGITPTNFTNAGNIVSNPMLATDFKLLAGSPGINAGINVGFTYSGTAPDIGAYEFDPPYRTVTVVVTVSDSTGATGTDSLKIKLK